MAQINSHNGLSVYYTELFNYTNKQDD